MNCEEFNCIEVPVPDRKDEVHLEHCIKKFLSKEEVQYWEGPSCSKCGSNVKKMALKVVPWVLIIQWKKLRKLENSDKNIHKGVKSPINKTVIGSGSYGLKRVLVIKMLVKSKLPPGSGCGLDTVEHHPWKEAISLIFFIRKAQYQVTVNFKESWWNCKDAVVKGTVEEKVVSEVAYILFSQLNMNNILKLKCQIELLICIRILVKYAWISWLRVPCEVNHRKV